MGRRLVVDVDDTISVTVAARDYANSQPIQPMIDKLNGLYDQGWEIVYATARGQVSMAGDLDRINNEIKPVLVKWLDQHGVKYTEIRMGKPFGEFYIDDKAMLPEEFLAADFCKLEGRSGAFVERVGSIVVKTCDNVQAQTDWYYACPEDVPTPDIVSVGPTNYRMRYLDGRPGWQDLEAKTVHDVVKYIQTFKGMKAKRPYTGVFQSYVERSTRNVPDSIRDEVTEMSEDWRSYCDTQHSFCHGDLTLDNVIVTDKTYLIDPSIQPGIWSSWLIDVGRIMQSLDLRYEEHFKGADYDGTKAMYIPYILDVLDLDPKLVTLMQILIYCRILHHQYDHSESDGWKTETQLTQLMDLYND